MLVKYKPTGEEINVRPIKFEESENVTAKSFPGMKLKNVTKENMPYVERHYFVEERSKLFVMSNELEVK